jgi:hypothetical protein
MKMMGLLLLSACGPVEPSPAPDAGPPKPLADICSRGGAPQLQIGQGQVGYLEIAPNAALTAEAGPQGGHHVWLAVRMQNMRQLSRTVVSAVEVTTQRRVPDLALALSYVAGEGGYCTLYGLRYQFDATLDATPVDYKFFLGKELDVTISLSDETGASVQATKRIRIAEALAAPPPEQAP